MDAFHADNMDKLVRERGRACISIYLPTHKTGRETMQDTVRLKNLLNLTEQRLIQRGFRPSDARDMLEPARGLIGEGAFWVERDEGLCVFLSESVFRYFRLPFVFGERVYIDSCFNIRPLLPVAVGEMPFNLLCVSQKRIRLYRGTRYRIDEIPLPTMPHGVSEALMLEATALHLQFRSQRGGQSSPGTYHGQEPDFDNRKNYLSDYLHTVNRALHGTPANSHLPVVFAGVEYLYHLYRQLHSTLNVMGAPITGNPDLLSTDELQKRALEIVTPYYLRAQHDLLQTAGGLLERRSPRASTDMKAILPGAFHGRVDKLLVTVDAEMWGTFDTLTGTTRLSGNGPPPNRELINLAVIFTFEHAGNVFPAAAGALPREEPIVAVFRY